MASDCPNTPALRIIIPTLARRAIRTRQGRWRSERMVVLRPLSKLAVVLPLLGLFTGIPGVRNARADRIMLRGGGQIRGKVVPDPKHPDRVTVLTETGKTPLRFQKPQVLRVVA